MIEVLYTCDSCGTKDAKVSVRERGGAEDILEWMDVLTKAVGADHFRKSPYCCVTSLTNVKIPIAPTEGSRIGDPTKQ